MWVVAGHDFGSKSVNNMPLINFLYILKSSGAAFRAFLAETLAAMGYRPSYFDPVWWLQPAVNTDGFEYYEYTLCYVDDVLCISHNPHKLMKRI